MVARGAFTGSVRTSAGITLKVPVLTLTLGNVVC